MAFHVSCTHDAATTTNPGPETAVRRVPGNPEMMNFTLARLFMPRGSATGTPRELFGTLEGIAGEDVKTRSYKADWKFTGEKTISIEIADNSGDKPRAIGRVTIEIA